MYKFTPGALEFLFDKSLSVNCEESNELRVIVETELRYNIILNMPTLNWSKTFTINYALNFVFQLDNRSDKTCT